MVAGPLVYAGTKLGVIILIARLSADVVKDYTGEPEVNWTVLLTLSAHRVNRWERERERGT